MIIMKRLFCSHVHSCIKEKDFQKGIAQSGLASPYKSSFISQGHDYITNIIGNLAGRTFVWKT